MAKVRGAKEVRRAIKRAGPEVQEMALKNVRKSAQQMHRDTMNGLETAAAYGPFYHGGLGMRRITGIFRRNYRWSISKTRLTGRVGFLSARAARAAFYASMFFYGTQTQPARPVHDDAFEANRESYIRNQTVGLRAALARIFP